MERILSIANDAGADRRKYPRSETRFFAVVRRFVDNREASLPQCAYVRNVSAGGLLLYSLCGVAEGNRIALTIYSDKDWTGGGVPHRVEVEGEVKRVKSDRRDHPSGGLREVAIQFIREPTMIVLAKEPGPFR